MSIPRYSVVCGFGLHDRAGMAQARSTPAIIRHVLLHPLHDDGNRLQKRLQKRLPCRLWSLSADSMPASSPAATIPTPCSTTTPMMHNIAAPVVLDHRATARARLKPRSLSNTRVGNVWAPLSLLLLSPLLLPLPLLFNDIGAAVACLPRHATDTATTMFLAAHIATAAASLIRGNDSKDACTIRRGASHPT